VQRTFKAIVVMLNAKTIDVGSILAIARTEARRREQSKENPPIRALKYFSELGIYVAVYEAVENPVGNVKQTG
jgi:hypothetical protein